MPKISSSKTDIASANKRIVVFDLDDTLYDEINYVKSGFGAVAKFIEGKWGIDREEAYKEFLSELKRNGRGKIFDSILKKHNKYNKKNVKLCLSVYRKHKPKLELPKSTLDCFKRLKHYPLYVVTDGNKVVQSLKADSLNLSSFVRKVFVTHRYGLHSSKPSPACFLRICAIENTSPEHVVYIGDNPIKDFIGIKPLGFRTIRIHQGAFANKVFPKMNEANWNIQTLRELTPELLSQVFQS
jgi:putative hydrolase of the HAD superfamily